MPVFQAGNVFRNPPGGTHGHVHVLIAANEKGQFLLTNWTSVGTKKKFDRSCILHAGDHPLITHDSFLYYTESQEMTEKGLQEAINMGNLVQDADLSPAVYQQVLDGARKSPFLSPDIKQRYKLQRS